MDFYDTLNQMKTTDHHMNDPIVWIIIAAFYAPLHYLLPILTVAISAPDDPSRKTGIKSALIDATLSMLIAFALVIWLARDHMSAAMAILFLSMLVPFGHALWLRRRWTTSGEKRAA